MSIEMIKTNDQHRHNKTERSSWDQHKAVRECLISISESDGFWAEEQVIENIFKTDFYIPSVRLCIEINGQTHFYPYTLSKQNQITNFKQFMLKNSGDLQERSSYNVLNLNSRILNGLMKEPKNLKSMLERTIKMYQV